MKKLYLLISFGSCVCLHAGFAISQTSTTYPNFTCSEYYIGCVDTPGCIVQDGSCSDKKGYTFDAIESIGYSVGYCTMESLGQTCVEQDVLSCTTFFFNGPPENPCMMFSTNCPTSKVYTYNCGSIPKAD